MCFPIRGEIPADGPGIAYANDGERSAAVRRKERIAAESAKRFVLFIAFFLLDD
jgi:hypothetical protein